MIIENYKGAEQSSAPFKRTKILKKLYTVRFCYLLNLNRWVNALVNPFPTDSRMNPKGGYTTILLESILPINKIEGTK